MDLGNIPIPGRPHEGIATTCLATAQLYNIMIGISPEELRKWQDTYLVDSHFKEVIESLQELKSHILPKFPQYQYDDSGLLFFENSNGNSRLCISEPLWVSVMDEIHNSLTEAAHGGYHRCYNCLAATHYWPGMSRDL